MQVLRYSIYPLFMSIGVFLFFFLSGKIDPLVASLISILVLGSIVFYLERLLSYDPNWNRNIGDLFTDIIHNLVNFLFITFSFECIQALRSKTSFPSFLPEGLPYILQVLIAGIFIDLGMYWVHRLSHSVPFLWRLHSVHHSSERLYWLNGEKRHPIHAILEGSPGILLILILGASSQVVLGWLTILSIHLMFQHGNMDYKSGFLKYIFSVAELHRWHHRKKYRETQVNYGAVFSFWDRIFDSYLNGEGFVKGAEVGLERRTSFPKDYLGQLTEPFK
ncbi:sterol desaturase family protein [Leptospira haakeii]|uniref:Fatty acid hydroxylase domain-containing protein n=1 Tax=Leptospira haakeii TaxID=2023198 RepID=A0ABX4PGQ6_9LEPT|nr:sterol desaturase family protein [Leptospira haakeii]PKA14952.1 hypothetical protein CH363_16325 [Leptospira haakeii]PKA20395.1 hypothetical protein CH377_05575 [Leptospira haakeii]